LTRRLTNLIKHLGMYLTEHLALIPVGDTIQSNLLEFNTWACGIQHASTD